MIKNIYFTIFAKKIVMSDFHILPISTITRETLKAVSITFDVPAKLKETFSFLPGQYVTLKTVIDGKEIRRAYSICSASQSGVLKVAIKEVEHGVFSTYANTTLTEGTSLEVHAPEGTFILKPQPEIQQTYAAFVAGSGITPVMSMIASVLTQEPNSSFVLVYGNKTPQDTIFYDALIGLQAQYPNRLFVEFIYSRAEEHGAHFGRIEKPTINYVLKNKFKDTVFADFYLCGPEAMINLVTEVLIENKIAKEQIHFELFTSSASTDTPSVVLDGTTTITILVDDEETTFTMDQNKTILDAALAKDIDAPYSCQGGICSSCICKVTEGTATMTTNAILTDGEIEQGLILACQAHPTSDTITVDFDDV